MYIIEVIWYTAVVNKLANVPMHHDNSYNNTNICLGQLIYIGQSVCDLQNSKQTSQKSHDLLEIAPDQRGRILSPAVAAHTHICSQTFDHLSCAHADTMTLALILRVVIRSDVHVMLACSSACDSNVHDVHTLFPSSSWSCQCPCGCGTVEERYISSACDAYIQ